ncbi:hypothetical protein [Bradyrhizobium sp. BR 10289]|uniref:hypothetical protein n=1 Tax=Bradyrhizobium sp. BR 10289 TaxID=2749993 RepID=UPI001C64FC79|nr:hypothetical protein [Bradyrhizobium sp. BR 10289]MBW7970032.1 hypothetical protein [Bradyrhizobium sp. BR 10289]
MALEKHQTDDVFGVSRDIPISYVERKHVDDKLLENITRNKHIIIFGSSKQGKTCLRRHCLHDDDYIVVQCQNNWDIAKLCEAILKAAGCEVEISNTKTVEGKAKLSVKAKGGFKIFGIGTEVEGGSEGEKGSKSEVRTEPIELDASDPNDLVRALKGIEFQKLIVLEDFHYLPQETQEQFAFALKTVHEASKITFIIVAVWREENRLIVYNGDLAGRVISVDADAWSSVDLQRVIKSGEELLNVQFPAAFKAQLITDSLNSVYVVQECCYKACKLHDVHSTKDATYYFPEALDAQKLVAEVIQEQSARYGAFVTNFAAGFGETQLEMYKWLLYPVLTSTIDELTTGLTYRQIRTRIESKHPQGNTLNPGNLTQALQSVPALQAKKNIKPFVLDYDRSNLRLSVVDKGFLIWLAAQDRGTLLEMVGLPTLNEDGSSRLAL